jgi:hypothetical protein
VFSDKSDVLIEVAYALVAYMTHPEERRGAPMALFSGLASLLNVLLG